MSRTRIKFCGMRSHADMVAAAEAGADAVGFVFHPASKRHVQASDVRAWLQDRPPCLDTVFLFMNAEADVVSAVLDQVLPDYLQFHGSENGHFCRQFGQPWLKALPMGAPDSVAPILVDCADAAGFLADSHGGPSSSGGSGHGFDWSLIANLPSHTFIAGGLDPENVSALVREHQPWGVDVSSGIEDAPGQKSALKMQAFARAVYETDAALRNAPST